MFGAAALEKIRRSELQFGVVTVLRVLLSCLRARFPVPGVRTLRCWVPVGSLCVRSPAVSNFGAVEEVWIAPSRCFC